jgi:hypothetical protein
VVDLATLEATTQPLPPANSSLLTRRYRHVMAPYGTGLVMAGGQVDDGNGLGVNTLNVVDLGLNTRQFELRRTFGQPGGKADVLFLTSELGEDALSFVATTLIQTNALESHRDLKLLNLTTKEISNTAFTPMVRQQAAGAAPSIMHPGLLTTVHELCCPALMACNAASVALRGGCQLDGNHAVVQPPSSAGSFFARFPACPA